MHAESGHQAIPGAETRAQRIERCVTVLKPLVGTAWHESQALSELAEYAATPVMPIPPCAKRPAQEWKCSGPGLLLFTDDEPEATELLAKGFKVEPWSSKHRPPSQCSAMPQILKGIGKINGDGWKDTTTKGEIVYAWNTELPRPYKEGQFPRVGNEIWSASIDQYDFTPATPEEAKAAIEELLTELRNAAQPQGRDAERDVRTLLWEACPTCCGNTVEGASYMGSTEEVCCGQPDIDTLGDAEIVKRLRAMFPEPAVKVAESAQEVANG